MNSIILEAYSWVFYCLIIAKFEFTANLIEIRLNIISLKNISSVFDICEYML